jgi:hypothetical protein
MTHHRLDKKIVASSQTASISDQNETMIKTLAMEKRLE